MFSFVRSCGERRKYEKRDMFNCIKYETAIRLAARLKLGLKALMMSENEYVEREERKGQSRLDAREAGVSIRVWLFNGFAG